MGLCDWFKAKIPSKPAAVVPAGELMDPARWEIGPTVFGVNKSKQMPPRPSAPWQFKFPNGDGVHGVTTAAKATQFIRIKFSILCSDDVVFQSYHQGQPDPVAAKVTLYFQAAGTEADIWNGPGFRFYSDTNCKLALGAQELSVPLIASVWHGVYGKQGAYEQEFAKAVANMARLGMGFGGNFDMHGVGVVKGWAEFHLREIEAV